MVGVPFQPSLFGFGDPNADPSLRTLRRFPLDGQSWVDLAPGWLRGPDTLFTALAESAPWQQRARWMYDHRVAEPRLTCGWTVADAPPPLDDLGCLLSQHYGVDFDSTAMVLPADEVVELDLAATELTMHPDLPPVPAWGFGVDGEVTAPGPLLEGTAYQQVMIRWRNRLPGPVYPQDPDRPVPQLPFSTSVVDDPNGETDSVQNELGAQGGVFAGLAGGYLLRDPGEADLGLPTCVEDGEIHLLVQDRNLDATDGTLRLLHKTTPDTAEFFGPLTLVDGLLWPRLRLRPDVFRLRLLNGSNARAYRLHLVSVTGEQAGMGSVTVEHDRLLVIGTDGGLLWRAWQPGADDALTLAPAERLDVLLDLTELAEGSTLYLINSAQAPFGGKPARPLGELLACGDRAGRNPYPWVARIDVDTLSPWAGPPAVIA